MTLADVPSESSVSSSQKHPSVLMSLTSAQQASSNVTSCSPKNAPQFSRSLVRSREHVVAGKDGGGGDGDGGGGGGGLGLGSTMTGGGGLGLGGDGDGGGGDGSTSRGGGGGDGGLGSTIGGGGGD